MPPLGLLVIGLVVVGVDLRYNSFDFVPDAIGWPLALLGLGGLVGRHGWFQLALASALVGMGVAVLQLVGATGSLIGLLDVVSGTGVVFCTCSGIMAVVEEPDVRHTADLIRRWDLALVVVTAAAVGIVGEDLGVAAIALIAAVLAVGVWFLVFCWGERNRPELSKSRVRGD